LIISVGLLSVAKDVTKTSPVLFFLVNIGGVPFTEIMMFLLLSIHGMNFNSKCGGGFLGQFCRLSTGFSEAFLDGNI